MKKGLVFIFGVERRVRFVTSGAFKTLETRHRLTYVLVSAGNRLMEAETVRSSADLGNQDVVWLPQNRERYQYWVELFDLACLTYAEKSPSFRHWFQERKHGFFKKRFLKRLAASGKYEHHKRRIKSRLGLNPAILQIVLKYRPDYILLPSGILDGITEDVLQVAEALSIPTLLMTAGWDNLSSKGILVHKPTRMTVWGRQCIPHAVEIQGMPEDRVHPIGIPYFDGMKELSLLSKSELRELLGVPRSGNLLLFAGAFRLFDETALLREIEDAVEKGKLPPLHVLYRPHPLRQLRTDEESFFSSSWKYVSMDSLSIGPYRFNKGEGGDLSPDSFLQRMQHLYRIYRAVDAVVTPMSSILAESLLFGLPTLAVAYGDGKHSWSADKVASMLHFKEYFDVPGVVTCRERQAFFGGLIRVLSQVGDETLAEQKRAHSKYFIHHDEHTYADRLHNLVEEMITAEGKSPLYDQVRLKPGKSFSFRAKCRRSLPARAWNKLMRTVRPPAITK